MMIKTTKNRFQKWGITALLFLFFQTGCLNVKLSPFNNTDGASGIITLLSQSILADLLATTTTPVTTLNYAIPELFTQNYPGSFTPPLTITPDSCSVSPALPAGLSLDPVTCTISGTATTLQGKTTYTLTASNSQESVILTIIIGVVQPFQFTVKTDNAGNIKTGANQFQLPLDSAGTYNFQVEWGDGTSHIITAWDQAEKVHTYGGVGTYTITISGKIDGFGFKEIIAPYTEDPSKLIDVANWGQVKLHNNGAQFASCDLLPSFTATDTPELTHITNMWYMFRNAAIFNGNISAWDTSSVT
ncbi:MAG: BspA family leucine-rich repeat surface protein, partial [Spirochaetia bacterium]|nr:BspA family leucine-rich repeat surface protein [Spirochaetia bacterium]